MKPSIAYIITRLDRGGTTGVITSLALDGVKREYTPFVICGDTQNGREIAKKYMDIEFYFVKELVREISPLRDIVALVKVMKILKRKMPDIVHTHTSKGGAIGRIAAYLVDIPIVIHTPHGHVFEGYFSKLKSSIFIIIERNIAKITDVLVGIS